MPAFLSRSFAVEVARLVGGQVKKNDRNVSEEPDAEYRVCVHSDRFWVTARLGDGRLVFCANHKRGIGEMTLFAAAFRHAYQRFWKIYPQITESWRMPILGWEAEAEVSGIELMDRLRPRYRDWIAAAKFERFHFCDVQTKTIATFTSASDAAQIICTLKQFMLDVDSIVNELDPEKRLIG